MLATRYHTMLTWMPDGCDNTTTLDTNLCTKLAVGGFTYFDFVEFARKPVIAYSQKTWKLSSGEPMHAESGFWRPKPDGTLEVVIAQSTGLVEVQVLSFFLAPISELLLSNGS